MPIQFRCPSCSKAFRVCDDLAGQVAGCSCGAKFRIPGEIPPPKTESTTPEATDEEALFAPESSCEDMAEDIDDSLSAGAPDAETADEGNDEAETDEPGAEDDAAALAGPTSWPGRILILLGAACIVAGLFLPWHSLPADDPTSAPAPAVVDTPEEAGEPSDEGGSTGEGEEEPPTLDWGTGATESDVETEAETSEPSAPTAEDSSPDAAAPAAAQEPAPEPTPLSTVPVSPTGMVLGQKLTDTDPMGHGVFSAVGLAVLLAVLALVPGKILSGTPQVLVGALLTVGTPAAAVLSLLALAKTHGDAGQVTVVMEHAEAGLFLTLGGAVACLLGGLICCAGVFRVVPPQKRTSFRDRGKPGRTSSSPSRRPSSAIKPPFAKKKGRKPGRRANLAPRRR